MYRYNVPNKIHTNYLLHFLTSKTWHTISWHVENSFLYKTSFFKLRFANYASWSTSKNKKGTTLLFGSSVSNCILSRNKIFVEIFLFECISCFEFFFFESKLRDKLKYKLLLSKQLHFVSWLFYQGKENYLKRGILNRHITLELNNGRVSKRAQNLI